MISNQQNTIDSMNKNDTGDRKALIALILGCVSIISWILPIVGLPVSIIGILFANKGMDSNKKYFAKIGLILCSVSLLATIANASIGVYLASHGQNAFINKVLK